MTLQIARAASCQAGADHVRVFCFGDEVLLVDSEVGDPHVEAGPVPEAGLVDHEAFRTARPEPLDQQEHPARRSALLGHQSDCVAKNEVRR